MIFPDKKIIGERILEIVDVLGIDLKELSKRSGIPYTTLQKYSQGKTNASSTLYYGLFNVGVDIHWFVSGEGEVFRPLSGTSNTGASYSYQGNNVAVHNNHGTVETGKQQSEVVGRGSQICAWVTEYMQTHDADDQVWLEVEMGRQFPEYKEWKKNR